MTTPEFNSNVNREMSRPPDFTFGYPAFDNQPQPEEVSGQTPQRRKVRPGNSTAGDMIVACVILGAAVVGCLGLNTEMVRHDFPQLAAVLHLSAPAEKAVMPTGADAHVKVWVDRNTALYYCSGSDLYGHTKNGGFLSQAEARLENFEPAERRNCTTPSRAMVAESGADRR